MTISLIAAIGENNEIGKNGELIRHLKGDLPFFKRVTMGKPVIMGRKTYESLPGVLPGRLNIVLSARRDFCAEGVTVVHSPSEALEKAKQTGAEEIFIIGGSTVYSEFLDIADRLYLTEARFSDSDADAFFPQFDRMKYSRAVLDVYDGDIPYEHVVYTKKQETQQ